MYAQRIITALTENKQLEFDSIMNEMTREVKSNSSDVIRLFKEGEWRLTKEEQLKVLETVYKVCNARKDIVSMLMKRKIFSRAKVKMLNFSDMSFTAKYFGKEHTLTISVPTFTHFNIHYSWRLLKDEGGYALNEYKPKIEL